MRIFSVNTIDWMTIADIISNVPRGKKLRVYRDGSN